MARVPLVDEGAHPELTETIGRLRAGRPGSLINVYRLLLHSPDVALGWFELIDAVRFRTSLDDATRELVIVRIAHLNGVPYILNQHVPAMARAAGLTPAQWETLADWRSSDAFDARQTAVLAYTDAMTVDVGVGGDVFAALRAFFGDREIVELTVLIGAYNMHSRVLRALEIDPEAVPAGVES